MQTRVAIVGIIVENPDSVASLNEILHEFSPYIIGRMGIPYRKHNINVISVAMDAPEDKIADLTERLGVLPGISCEAAYSNEFFDA